MGLHVAHQVMRLMARKRIRGRLADPGAGADVQEDCPDLRNTRVVDIVRELRAANANVGVHDPWADADKAKRELGIELVAKPEAKRLRRGVARGGAQRFLELPGGVAAFVRDPGVVFDVKGVMPAGVADARLFQGTRSVVEFRLELATHDRPARRRDFRRSHEKDDAGRARGAPITAPWHKPHPAIPSRRRNWFRRFLVRGRGGIFLFVAVQGNNRLPCSMCAIGESGVRQARP